MESTENALPTVLGGRYEVGSLLGRGGTAQVFRGRDRLLDRAVAVKLFPSTVSGVASMRQDREVSTLAGFHHPGLVALYDAGHEQGRAFLVMQLIEGATMADKLRTGPWQVTATARLGAQLADALAYVHRHGVVHRDVKPANVLLDGDDRPFLSDFGIATLAESTQLTATGMVVGTAAYLAPEQVRGARVGPAIDIYALGLVILECLNGYTEYQGAPVEVAVARLHRCPRIPTRLSAELRTLVQAMTAQDADDRPSAAQVASRLRSVADSAQIPGGSVPTGPVAVTAPTSAVQPVSAAQPVLHAAAVMDTDRPTATATATRLPVLARFRRGRLRILLAVVAASGLTVGGLVVGRFVIDPAPDTAALPPATPAAVAPVAPPAAASSPPGTRPPATTSAGSAEPPASAGPATPRTAGRAAAPVESAAPGTDPAPGTSSGESASTGRAKAGNGKAGDGKRTQDKGAQGKGAQGKSNAGK